MAIAKFTIEMAADLGQLKRDVSSINDVVSKMGKQMAQGYQPSIEAVNAIGLAHGNVAKKAELSSAAQQKAAKLATYQNLQMANQLQDFGIQIAGGQNPLLAFVQQGSQLSAVYGGAGNALRAVTSLITPMRVALGGSALAVLGVAAAWAEGDKQSAVFRRSLELTGNAAGLTAGKFDALVESVSNSTKVGAGKVREMAQELVSSGRFGSVGFEEITKTATLMAEITGKSSEQVVQDLSAMADAPASWAESRNKSLHFITDAELKYIETLEANGKRQEAVYKVLEALGRRNTEKVASDVGYLQGIAKVAGEGWNSFWNSVYGIGRDTTIEQKVAELKDSIARMENSRGVIVDKSLLESQKKKLAEFQAQQGAAEKAAAESSKQAADVQSNTEKRRLQERLQGALLSQSLAKNEANAKLQVLDIEKRIAEIQQAAPIDSRDLAGQQKTAEQVGELKLLEMATERKKVLQEIAAVKAQPQDKPEQALAVQQQLIGLNSKLVDLESTKLGLQSQAYSGYVQQLQAFQEIKRAQELSLSFVGKTTEQVNAAIFADGLRVQTTRAIQAEYANLANGVITLTELEKRKSAIEREAAEASAAFYRLQADAMDRAYNATRGVSDAMLEYAQQSQRAGELAKQATASVLASMEDGFVNFFKTGKLNAASFVDTLIREFLRLQVVKPLMNNLVSAGGGDFFSSLFGAGTQGGVNQSAGLDSSLQAGGSVVAANGAVFGRGGVTAFANGGMFTNQIVTHPKRFAFAGGVGLMGEAGPEAVVPLRRDSRGRLGLMSAGGGSANVTVQVINQGNPLQVTSQTQTQGPDGGINIAVMVNAMQDAMAEGVAYGSGSLYHAMAGRFVKQGAG